MDTFTSIPPELRNMIYEFLLTSEIPFQISSPKSRRQRRCRTTEISPCSSSTGRTLQYSTRLDQYHRNKITSCPTSARANFLHLTLVSRQIRDEACTTFYSLNTFVIGNAHHRSTSRANIHALRTAFLKRVPARYVACIAHLSIHMHLRKAFGTGTPQIEYGIATASDASDLRYLSRAAVKHFVGLRNATVYPITGGYPRWWDEASPIGRDEGLEAVIKAFRILFTHEKLGILSVAKRDAFAGDYAFSRLQEAALLAIADTGSRVCVELVGCSYCVKGGDWCSCAIGH